MSLPPCWKRSRCGKSLVANASSAYLWAAVRHTIWLTGLGEQIVLFGRCHCTSEKDFDHQEDDIEHAPLLTLIWNKLISIEAEFGSTKAVH